jgi:hypothetical protein
MNVNREHKNSVFTTLFDDEDRVRELYAALKGVDYDPALPVVITTLRDVLYMNRINDLSFTAEKKFVFIVEHQSGLNRNMALRMLLYMSGVYEEIVDRRSLYRDSRVKIPAPEFIVLYNGTAETPDRWEERLSDAFMETAEGAEYSLDLRITVYNINKGRNPELLGRSEHLAGYAEFVARVRENEKAMPLARAVTEAIRCCVREGILAGFLEEHGSEVMNMLLEEWNWDEAKEVWLEEGMETGLKMAEAKYQPVIEEKNRKIEAKDRRIEEKDRRIEENNRRIEAKDREIWELRRKLREAGIGSSEQ